MTPNSRSYINHFIQPDSIIPDQTNPQSWDRYSYGLNNPSRYTDPSGHVPIEGCGDDGKGHCVASAAEETRNLQHLKKLTQDVYKRKCAAGNGAYCDGNPVEIAAFTIAMWTGGALLESFVLGGGAADASLAVFWKGVQSCISSAVCRGVTGMAGGTGAASQSSSLLQSGGTNNPRIGPIISRLTSRTTTYFRYWNTELGNESGAWVTTLETNSGAVAEDLLSMPYTPNAVSSATVPGGFRVQESLASPLFGNNGGLGHQIELLGSIDDVIFEFISFLK